MQIGLAQLNPSVGDIAGNAEKILDCVHESQKKGCELTLFPELALTGYPPEDLLLKPAFIKDNKKILRQLAPLIKKSVAVIGTIEEKEGKLYNAAVWVENAKIKTIYFKHCLPNYGVFDEQRYFSPGESFVLEKWQGIRVGLTICEDLWWGSGPLKKLKAKNPDLILNLSASPFYTGKFNIRTEAVQKSARFLKTPIIYNNLVGGQDELVFDGGSFTILPDGKISQRFPQFQTDLFPIHVERIKKKISLKSPVRNTRPLNSLEEIYNALVLGTRDYVEKNKFKKVALGLSGGIDSALVAAVATHALGPGRVVGVSMPSQFNSSETKGDAKQLATNLGIDFYEIPIEETAQHYSKLLAPVFRNMPPNIAEENIQARIRGNILMALSNKFGWLILTTGNKSEMATGYSTLYGDMAGGFAVLKDVIKTTVFKLSEYVNDKSGTSVIPESIITRPPTAELRANQKDEESLGPYQQLDRLIVGYVEDNFPIHKLTQMTGFDEDYVNRIIEMIDRNEYKRRQSPPGIKITPRAFGRDHRMPITNRYKPYRHS